MDSSLFAKVAMIVAGCMLVGGVGTYFGRFIQSFIALIVLCVVFVLGTFGVMAAAHAGPVIGLVALTGWVFISGLVIGPAVQMYAEQLGWETVCLSYVGSAGVMALCGAFGMLSGFDFSGMGSYLMIGLLGLIVMGVVGIFVRMSRTVNIVWSLFGMLIFAGYFIFDFFRVGHTENTMENAIMLSMNIYLDFINFFLYLLQFLAAVMDKH
jgi:FtsH-binding integral membrane protein